ncbi:hypothetical protein K435DRAFT_650815, partial [Dendrothele bispora CBS 962.96]
YFQSNLTGIKVQNRFERVYHQVRSNSCSYYTESPSLTHNPTEIEWSTILDPPIKGPGGNTCLSHVS